MNLGVRAHDFGKLPAEELARQIASHGLNCIQLAPTKALAGFDSDENGIPRSFAEEVRRTMDRHGIHVSVIGCYINLGDRNEALRRPQLERFKRHLRAARHFGCDIVGTETGSLNSDFSRHPDNGGEEAFRIVVDSVRELVHVAEQEDVNVCIEAVERYVISSPERLRRLIDEVGSSRLQVIYDPVNLLWSTNHEQQDDVMEAAHRLLGDRIRILHAKDFVVKDGVFQELPSGQGALHYEKLVSWLKATHPDIDMLLENTHPSTIGKTVEFMRKAWRT